MQLKEFHAPDRKLEQTYVLHDPPGQSCAGEEIELETKIISPLEPTSVELIVLGVGGGVSFPMQKADSYRYYVKLPGELTEDEQILRYHICVRRGESCLTYPEGSEGEYLLNRRIYADDRLLDDSRPYVTEIVKRESPVYLFDAEKDWHQLTKARRQDRIVCLPGPIPGKQMMHLSVKDLQSGEHNFTVGSYCHDRINERKADLEQKKQTGALWSFPPWSFLQAQVNLDHEGRISLRGDYFHK